MLPPSVPPMVGSWLESSAVVVFQIGAINYILIHQLYKKKKLVVYIQAEDILIIIIDLYDLCANRYLLFVGTSLPSMAICGGTFVNLILTMEFSISLSSMVMCGGTFMHLMLLVESSVFGLILCGYYTFVFVIISIHLVE